MTTARTGTTLSICPWVERFLPCVPDDGGRVLDVACGLGRHSLLAALYGYRVLAVDRDPAFAGRALGFPEIEFRRADLESGGWPLGSEKFAGIIVCNYLHRPLFPHLVDALEPGGVLICQTFTLPQAEVFGKPANPAHWLRAGELLSLVRPLDVAAYECGKAGGAYVERICAVKEAQPGAALRFPLRSK